MTGPGDPDPSESARPGAGRLARLREVRAEGVGSLTIRGGLAGAGASALALAGGARFRPAIAAGAAVAAASRGALRGAAGIGREIQNSADAAVIAGVLGEHTPPLGGWAIEPDFGVLVLEASRRRPDVVVECGSGITTLLVAATLRANGAGHLYSLEHDAIFAEETERRLAAAELEEWVTVLLAPLRAQPVAHRQLPWYAAETVATLPPRVDVLVVDGPPDLVPLARWPALELLEPRLPAGSVVLLDDGRRPHERRTAMAWRRSHPDFDLYWLDTVKGTWRLERRGPRPGGAGTERLRHLRRTLNPRPAGRGRWPVGR